MRRFASEADQVRWQTGKLEKTLPKGPVGCRYVFGLLLDLLFGT